MKYGVTAIKVQTSAIEKMKKDVVDAASEFIYDVKLSGYCDYSAFKDEIRDMVGYPWSPDHILPLAESLPKQQKQTSRLLKTCSSKKSTGQ